MQTHRNNWGQWGKAGPTNLRITERAPVNGHQIRPYLVSNVHLLARMHAAEDGCWVRKTKEKLAVDADAVWGVEPTADRRMGPILTCDC